MPVGQRSKGPDGLCSHDGVRCHLPKHEVLYPDMRSTWATVAASGGMALSYPGKEFAISVMPPMCTA